MFADRRDAGQQLALCLSEYAERDDVIVVGLPRGGVPVAREVATLLGLPFDVIIVRKLGVPYQPEVAMGAIGETGVRYVDHDLINRAGVSQRQLVAVEQHERRELDERVHRFREGREPMPLEGRVVIVVDDGIATGATARAACLVARGAGAKQIVLASPVAPPDWVERLRGVADDLVAVATPSSFSAVGYSYRDFAQVTDTEVTDCLHSVAAQNTARRDRRATKPEGH